MDIKLFNSNLDATLIGTPGAAHHFHEAWEQIPQDKRPVLVYNSGRPLDEICEIVKDSSLPDPQYIIAGVGTQLLDYANDRLMHEYTDTLIEGWDIVKIDELVRDVPGVRRQEDENQNLLKSSWYLDNADRETVHLLRERLKSSGLQVTVVYSSFLYLDIIPARTNKGLALSWLCRQLDISLNSVLVAGSSANDASCYYLPGVRGIAVENAKPELFEAVVSLPVYRSPYVMSEGIVDGLLNYGLIDKAPYLATPSEGPDADPDLRMLFSADAMVGLTEEETQYVETAYGKAIESLRRCITPMGFSAASMEDNEVTGTDENYNSVWARDGAITTICTLDLPDEDIIKCQKATLTTLFEAISPAGQLPANVRLLSHQPDYSGVGGICAIDSNLWLIIAMYQFAHVRNDMSLIQKYRGQLQRAMDWISAHDSNNDGLIEVPEASDWTDLFGRSYNVLYDEVLWFRANVCYARILEMLGDHERAGHYHQWSQFIQGKIIRAFWPSSEPGKHHGPEHQLSFADNQYSLGDARYMLAEITPFNFNWRCDVFGNVLSFLYGVIDPDMARTAFAFMWGCGVNKPYPVSNLYPVVQAGDPDWRSYYTVNLLNLPDHYHNGGIWPFVGGMWVRFIHRLGQHEVACKELVKLAELNQKGIREEWEFNEWAHGETGRVMGKRYQAWSAASFIRACHELQLEPGHNDGEE
jgi:sucrose-6F-phosphate phosphohydrolase